MWTLNFRSLHIQYLLEYQRIDTSLSHFVFIWSKLARSLCDINASCHNQCVFREGTFLMGGGEHASVSPPLRLCPLRSDLSAIQGKLSRDNKQTEPWWGRLRTSLPHPEGLFRTRWHGVYGWVAGGNEIMCQEHLSKGDLKIFSFWGKLFLVFRCHEEDVLCGYK